MTTGIAEINLYFDGDEEMSLRGVKGLEEGFYWFVKTRVENVGDP
jgi:hypothetical protein